MTPWHRNSQPDALDRELSDLLAVANEEIEQPAVPALRADCCSARAVHRVQLPATDTNTFPATLWLCGHHFRQSSTTLAKAGAIVRRIDVEVSSRG